MTARRCGSAVVVASCAAIAAFSQPKPTQCTLVPQPNTRVSFDSTPVGSVVFIGGGALFKCPSRGITLRGDSAEKYPDHDYIIGHVVYDEPRLHLTSDFLYHYPADERVLASGNVHARLPSGSTLVGPIAEYFRAKPPLRTRDQVLAKSRPTIDIVEKDSTGRLAPPTNVVADQVFMDGDSLVYAWGQVVITRPEIRATADSAFINQGPETMRLMRKPLLVGKKDRPFTLSGDLIDLFSRKHKLQRVLSQANATAVSDSMTITSDTIDLRIRNDQLDHAFAWGGKSRAHAVSPSQTMTADSLDVSMPANKVSLVRAVRKAFAESKPDTTHFKVEKPDTTNWILGDTITAHFDSAQAKDTSKAPTIKQLVADGHAHSLYHLNPSDTTQRRPAISYQSARTITIDFDSARVARVISVDSVAGYFIEPKADSTARAANAATPPGKALPKSVVPIPTVPPRPPPPGLRQ